VAKRLFSRIRQTPTKNSKAVTDPTYIDGQTQLQVLRAPPNERLDRLARAAAAVFSSKAAVVTLIDGDRISFRAMFGTDMREKPRHLSFTPLIIEADGPFVINDTATDPRVREHPAAIYTPQIRFLVGQAIHGPDDEAVGAVVVWDSSPGSANEEQLAALADLTSQIEWELFRWELFEAKRRLEDSEERLSLALEGSGQVVWDWDVPAATMTTSAHTLAMLGHEPEALSGDPWKWDAFFHPDDKDRIYAELRRVFKGRADVLEIEYRMRCKDGSYKWVLDRGKVSGRDERNRPLRILGTLTDIDARKQAEQERIRQAERMALAVQAGGVGIFEHSLDSRIYSWDARMYELFGVNPDSFTPTLHEFIRMVHPEDRGHLRRLLDGLRQGAPGVDTEFRIVRPDGSVRDLRVLGKVLLLSDDAPRLLIGTCWDVTDARNLQRQLAHQASHDALTGLANRFEFERRLEMAVRSARHTGKEHAVCFIDLDRFKLINDTAGHAAGDMLLRELGQLLAQQVRRSDMLARLGGDEFGLLLDNCPQEQAERIANELIARIDAFKFRWDGRIYDVSASIGIACVGATAGTAAEIMSQADIACYAAKTAGRSRISVYRPEHSEAQQYHRELLLAAGIREALAEDRFCLHAQEIMASSPEPGIRHYELLLRMRDAEGQLIPPGNFIPAAERYELMTHIDRWVLRQVLEHQADTIAAIPGLVVAVNLSAQSLNDPAFVPYILALIDASPLTPDRIVLEITETAAVTHLASASNTIGRLREAGCRVALDDFGSGLSSFNYLKHFPVDYVKIDGSFIRALTDSAVDRTIVESIHGIARKLGSRTVAEYVEDQAILAVVQQIGIDFAQGYGIGRPQPLDEVLAALRSSSQPA